MKTQAWGWLVAAVLAAGLNASYHDGGLEWAHRIAEGVEHSSNAVLALATGHADRFLAEAQMLGARDSEPPAAWNRSTYESIRPAVVGPNEPDAYPSGVLAGPA